MITYFRKYKFNKNDLREGTKIYIGITRYLKIAIVNIARGKIVIDFTVHEEQSNKKKQKQIETNRPSRFLAMDGLWKQVSADYKTILTSSVMLTFIVN